MYGLAAAPAAAQMPGAASFRVVRRVFMTIDMKQPDEAVVQVAVVGMRIRTRTELVQPTQAGS